jgi:hypothetical protein
MNEKTNLQFAKDVEEKSNKNIERLQFMYEEMFYLNSGGEKELKPNVTLQQLKFIKEKLMEIDAIYKDRNMELEAFKKDKEEADVKSTQTRDNLASFCSKCNIEVPDVFKKLYRL